MQNPKTEISSPFVFSWKLAAVFVVVIFINVFTCMKYKNQEVSQNTNITAEANSNTENYYYNTSYNY